MKPHYELLSNLDEALRDFNQRLAMVSEEMRHNEAFFVALSATLGEMMMIQGSLEDQVMTGSASLRAIAEIIDGFAVRLEKAEQEHPNDQLLLGKMLVFLFTEPTQLAITSAVLRRSVARGKKLVAP